ncbi:MAG: DNA-binding response regulator [Myxococcaceae bacterium]
MARLTLVEDDATTRAATTALLQRLGHEVTPLSKATQAVSHARQGTLGELVLFDLELEGTPGFDALTAMRAAAPDAKVVALTAHAGPSWVFAALEAGCVGYVLKYELTERLPSAITDALGGGSPLSSRVARLLLEHHYPASAAGTLSKRELNVLRGLADGFTYEQVALRLGVSLSTVRTYVERLYAKLDVHSKSEATAKALRLKLFG